MHVTCVCEVYVATMPGYVQVLFLTLLSMLVPVYICTCVDMWLILEGNDK